MGTAKTPSDMTASPKTRGGAEDVFSSSAWFKDYPPAVKALTNGTTEEQLAALDAALATGADADAIAPDGASAAKLALKTSNLAALRALNRAGAGFADRRWSPLHRAVLFGTSDEVATLATPETCSARDSLSKSPLLLACSMGLTATAQILWPLTPVPSRQSLTGDGENALILAASDGNRSLVDWLLHEGVPVDWSDRYGGTALLAAVGNGDHDMVAALLNRGANPNPKQNISAAVRDLDAAQHPARTIANRLLSSMKALMPEAFRHVDSCEDTFVGALDLTVDAKMVRLLMVYGYPLEQVPSVYLRVAIGADLIADPARPRSESNKQGSTRGPAPKAVHTKRLSRALH